LKAVTVQSTSPGLAHGATNGLPFEPSPVTVDASAPFARPPARRSLSDRTRSWTFRQLESIAVPAAAQMTSRPEPLEHRIRSLWPEATTSVQSLGCSRWVSRDRDTERRFGRPIPRRGGADPVNFAARPGHIAKPKIAEEQGSLPPKPLDSCHAAVGAGFSGAWGWRYA
jgi:hypothetical protein